MRPGRGWLQVDCALSYHRVAVENGVVTLPQRPGIGFEGKADLYRGLKAIGA